MSKHSRIQYFVANLPILLLHLAALTAFWLPFKVEYLAICFISYFIRMFAITAGYHRYFSHRSYKMNRVAQFVMAFLGGSALQKGALWWAAHHRHHHRHSDQPADIHSPVQRGFWWSHLGWILSFDHTETRWELIGDLARFPELRWLNRWEHLPALCFTILLYFAAGIEGVVWGMAISTILLWHGTFTINSLSHIYGTVRYTSNDSSRNNFILALITLGEGWHNNHHAYMSSANQGFFWWEIDMSFYLLKGLSWCGLVYDLRKAPIKLLERKRVVNKQYTNSTILNSASEKLLNIEYLHTRQPGLES